jgi:hypothetical protein
MNPTCYSGNVSNFVVALLSIFKIVLSFRWFKLNFYAFFLLLTVVALQFLKIVTVFRIPSNPFTHIYLPAGRHLKITLPIFWITQIKSRTAEQIFSEPDIGSSKIDYVYLCVPK